MVRAQIFDGRKMLRYDEWLIYSIKCLGICYRHIQKIGKLVWLLSENLELYVRQPKLYVKHLENLTFVNLCGSMVHILSLKPKPEKAPKLNCGMGMA